MKDQFLYGILLGIAGDLGFLYWRDHREWNNLSKSDSANSTGMSTKYGVPVIDVNEIAEEQ